MAPEPDSARLNAGVAGLLRDSGFRVREEQHGFLRLVRAERPGCMLLAGDYDPHGTFDQAFRQFAVPIGPLRFAYRGRAAEAAPKLRPLLEYYYERELRRIGVPAGRAPIVAFAATPGCRAADLPWRRVAALPG
jgi:hypothetical protein